MRFALPVLLAPTCASCGGSVTAGLAFCDACAPTAFPAPCGPPGTAAFVYVGAVARALTRLKAERRAEVARPLGDLLWTALAPRVRDLGGPVVVPVPLHPARLAERGFNQASLLAMRVARRLGAPLWPSALTRIRDTPNQATLRRDARRACVQGAFVAREPEHIVGHDVVLVDDVATTGATLAACAAALIDAGARAVHPGVVARAGY
jgi:ComF family protein